MLANKRMILPVRTGDWEVDGPNIYNSINKYFLSLQSPGSLGIAKMDYWTPVVTFATPGDLAVAYTTAVGEYTKVENDVFANFRIVTSSFTHTTAAGNLKVTGFPFVSNSDTGFVWDGVCGWGGITMAGGRTQVNVSMTVGSADILFTACGSAVAPATITSAEVPTGGSVVLRGSFRVRL